MLVEVPISVHTPPNMDAKERGINSFSGLIFIALEQLNTTGIKSATTGVLLINADKKETKMSMEIAPSQKFRRNNFSNNAVTGFNTPLFSIPALNTNMDATVTTAVLLKPESPSCGLNIPLSIKLPKMSMAVTSIDTYSVANNMIAPSKMHRVMIISTLIKFSFT